MELAAAPEEKSQQETETSKETLAGAGPAMTSGAARVVAAASPLTAADAAPGPAATTSTTSTMSLVYVKGTTVPVIIFLNSNSGGRQGGKLLKKFQKWVGEAQVYDLANVRKGGPKPEEVLKKFEGVKNLRVVACGGPS